MPSMPKCLLVVFCAAALTTVSAGCGDDQPSTGDSQASATTDGSSPSSESPSSPDSPATDEEQIKTLIATVQQAFKDGDGQLICDSLSPPGQRDLVYYGRLTNFPGPCPKVASELAKRNQTSQAKLPQARVLKVQVNGKQAVALVRASQAPPVRQRYDNINGTWKIHSFRIGEAVSGQPAP